MSAGFDPMCPEPGRLRQVAGKSQAEMAALVGSPSYRSWQDWEAGRRAMSAGLWELALIKTGRHPTLAVTPAAPTR